MHKHCQRSLFLLNLLLVGTSAFGASARRPAKKPAANQVKGQSQLAGASAEFGTVYSLSSGFNVAILSARYTLEPFVASETMTAATDKKLVVLDIAVKNARDADNFFNTEDLFTLVDQAGGLYTNGSLALASKGSQAPEKTLRPGQGLGQRQLNDQLRIPFLVPAKSQIVKIMINQGRLGHAAEKALRYYVAGATKAEAGENGDPKNVIAALPDAARDPADPSGVVAAEEGKGTAGEYAPSGSFALRLDGFAYSAEPLVDDSAPAEGKRYAVATVTAKNLTDQELSMFAVKGGDDPLYQIVDADGERYKPVAFRKAKRSEDADHTFKRGDEYTFRIVFTLPKDAAAKKLVLGTGNSRKWAFDISGAK